MADEQREMMHCTHCTAVIVAAGKGRRMGSDIPKQFLQLSGKPILYYTLKAFEDSEKITDIILVTGEDLLSYCQKEIVKKYGLTKVKKIVQGGAERYDSVYAGICACENADYVLIQDGVRPFISKEIIERGLSCAEVHGNAIAGVPSKDTVKIVDCYGKVQNTPDRNLVWNVQTPQIFKAELIRKAYESLSDKSGITDDAMVLERSGLAPVYMFRADYSNIKITTPEDLPLAESILKMFVKNEVYTK
jgi:2-C-methyl-D-erythritol 4-phosphate cytidylyltransferase